MILKEIENNGEKFKLVLRLKVKADPVEYKNSVLTFWHIGNVTWMKSLKNKKYFTGGNSFAIIIVG